MRTPIGRALLFVSRFRGFARYLLPRLSFYLWITSHCLAASFDCHTTYEKILPLQPEEGVFAYSRISPNGNFLSYASERHVGGDIKTTVNFIDLKSKKILYSEPGMDSFWSPDSNRVIYLSLVERETGSICIWHRDTGQVTRNIAPASLGNYFTWAKLRNKDVICTQLNRFFFLEGDQALRPYRTVPECPIIGQGKQPMMSRDGKYVASFFNNALVVRALETGNILLETHIQGGKADFSWDSRYIAFHRFKNGGESKGYEIIVVDLQDKKMIPVTNLPGSSYYPSWTHDGRLSFRYDSEDYRGFMMASNFLKNPAQPLPQPRTAAVVEKQLNLKQLYQTGSPPNHHVVLVNFWAGWCVHCRQELPTLERVRQYLRQKGLDAEIVGACEPSSFKSDRDRVIHDRNLTLPQVDIRPKDLADFGVPMFPTNEMFVDGKMVERRYGAQSYDQFIEWFEKMSAE